MANLTKTNAGLYANPWKDFFDIGFFGPKPQSTASLPAVNICEDEKDYTVEVVSPGFKKEDFKIAVNDDILTISAENKNESKDGNGKEYSRREYSYTSFTRSFRLPENAKDDALAAKYSDGILKISIPKTEQQQKTSRQISVE